MNTILENSSQIEYYTYLDTIFEAFEGKQNDYNWMITDFECNDYPVKELQKEIVWISGEELTEMVQKHRIQFIWAVLSGFKKDVVLDIDNLSVEPYAEGNPGFWIDNPKIQHPIADVEIICWDSSSTLLLSNDDDLTEGFRSYFRDSQDLNEYNQGIHR